MSSNGKQFNFIILE